MSLCSLGTLYLKKSIVCLYFVSSVWISKGSILYLYYLCHITLFQPPKICTSLCFVSFLWVIAQSYKKKKHYCFVFAFVFLLMLFWRCKGKTTHDSLPVWSLCVAVDVFFFLCLFVCLLFVSYLSCLCLGIFFLSFLDMLSNSKYMYYTLKNENGTAIMYIWKIGVI